VRHPTPTVVLVLSTNKTESSPPGSYLADFACGEPVSVDPNGRIPDQKSTAKTALARLQMVTNE